MTPLYIGQVHDTYYLAGTLALLVASPVRGRMVAARLFIKLPRRVLFGNY